MINAVAAVTIVVLFLGALVMFKMFSSPKKLSTNPNAEIEDNPTIYICYILLDLYHCKFDDSDNVVSIYENIKAFITRYLKKINSSGSMNNSNHSSNTKYKVSFSLTLFNYAPEGVKSSLQKITEVQLLSLVSLSNKVVSFATKAYINTIMLSHVSDEMCDSSSFGSNTGREEKEEFTAHGAGVNKLVCIASCLSVIEDVGVSLNLNSVAHILAVNSDQDFPSLPSFVRDAISWHAVRSGSRSEQQPALAAKSPTKSGEGRSIPPEQTAWAEGAGQRRPLEQPSAKAHGGGSVASALKACVQQSPLLPRKWTNVSDTILSGKYTFHDYESGVFFTTFIDSFSAYMASAFRVNVVDADKQQEPERPPRVGQGELKLPVFRVDLSGTKADISAARDYLDSLNNRSLQRHPVHFPRADARRYTELLQHKASFDATLRNFRQDRAEEDPMCSADGSFVSIRLKPSVHIKGVSRMNFPCDVTVTVCGPVSNEEQRSSLHAVESFFSGLPSGYETASVLLSSQSPVAKQLTVRASREAFVSKHDLASVRWLDESFVNGRNTVKIWARTQKRLNAVVELLLSQGGCLLSSTSKAIKLGNPQSPLGGCPQQVGFLGAFAGGLSDSADSSLDGSSGAGTAVTSQGSPERFASFAAEQQTIVEWPNASMRYIFLGEPQKSKLNDIVAYFRGCLGVTIASPYRDKHNPLSCMRIASSSREIMLEASGAIRALLAISLQHVRTVRLVMLDRQRAAVMADELALIKGIQGDAGVHVLLEPSRDDLGSCLSQVDLRLPFQEQQGGGGEGLPDTELIRVLAAPPGPSDAAPLSVSVLLSRNADKGWSFSRRSKVLLMVNALDLAFSPDEATKLSRGDVLLHTEVATGRTILTVRPSVCASGDVQAEADSFVRALIRGLSQADSVGYSDIVILAPKSVPSLPSCSYELLQSLTVETSVRFANFYAEGALRHVYCVDLDGAEADEVVSSAAVGSVPGLEFKGASLSEVTPASGSQMAAALLLLLDSSVRGAGSGYGISLEACNMPLPATFDAEPLAPGRRVEGGFGSPLKRGVSSIVIRGLPCGLVQAVRRMKLIVQQSTGKSSYSAVAQQHVKLKKG